MPKYKCGHCGYEGYCYGTLIGDRVSAPWCKQCERNDKLIELPDAVENGNIAKKKIQPNELLVNPRKESI